jgi:membrane protein DedA with SNARE-associated domain
VIAAVIGDNIGFAIGHIGGRPHVERFGRYGFLKPERLDKVTDVFKRHGGKIVVVARFIEGLRQANGIVAGISKMAWPRFLAFNALGAALWVLVWTSIGYLSGQHLDTIYPIATRYSTYLAIAVGVLLLGYIAWKLWRRRQASLE